MSAYDRSGMADAYRKAGLNSAGQRVARPTQTGSQVAHDRSGMAAHYKARGLSGNYGVGGPGAAAAPNDAWRRAVTPQRTAAGTMPGAGATGGGGVIQERRSLAQDPAWLAYLRSAGLEQQALQQDAAVQEQMIRRQLAGQLEDLGTRYDRAVEGVQNNYEARGIGGSGLENRDVGRTRADQAAAAAGLTSGVETRVQDLYQQVQRRSAELARRQAEMALTAQGNVSRI